MGEGSGFAKVAALSLVAGALSPSLAAAQAPERKPTFAFSVANSPPGRVLNGPLFERAKAALAAADKSGGAAFSKLLAPTPKLELSWDSEGRKTAPFTAQTIRAAARSCLGPFSYDEAPSWVQLSFICRVDKEAPLAAHLTFRHSPELTLTIWFEKGLIKEIMAMEPLRIPGHRLPAMNAYEVMKAAQ